MLKQSISNKIHQIFDYAQMIVMEGRQANDGFLWRWILYPISIMILFLSIV